MRLIYNRYMLEVKIVLEDGATMPQKATEGAAAYDLYCPIDTRIKRGRNVVPLGFRLQMPVGIQAQVEAADFLVSQELDESERGEGGFGHSGTN